MEEEEKIRQFAFSFCLKLVNRQSVKDKGGKEKKKTRLTTEKGAKSWVYVWSYGQ